jgi:hypothetical protein
VLDIVDGAHRMMEREDEKRLAKPTFLGQSRTVKCHPKVLRRRRR